MGNIENCQVDIGKKIKWAEFEQENQVSCFPILKSQNQPQTSCFQLKEENDSKTSFFTSFSKMTLKQELYHENQKIEILELSKQIFEPRKLKTHPKNSIRFLVRLAIKYLKEYKDDYPPKIYEEVVQKCQEIRCWKAKAKKNIYLLKHLDQILNDVETFSKEGTRLNKKVFRKVLLYRSMQQLFDPLSQIEQGKQDYLRVCKIYSLRCLNTRLTYRNQSK